jgi:hypothetical protein
VKKTALLLSGGIGDFLHYLSRIQDFLSARGLSPSDLLVCVESTVPKRVENMFRLAFPDLDFHFTPGQIHWTKTNPLLVPRSPVDRANRPAFQYLRLQGFSQIEDWFLPFLCKGYKRDLTPLLRIISSGQASQGQFVIVSARDKGFLWWPSEVASAVVQELLPTGIRPIYMGTPDEKLAWHSHLETPAKLEDALASSYMANLYVGTDTGLATIRELTGKENVYCINQFWLKKMMIGYDYLDRSTLKESKSIFTSNLQELRKALIAHFAREQSGEATR